DRIVILHSEGGRNSHRVRSNGIVAGTARDSGTPSEFELPGAVAGEANTLCIELPVDTREPESALAGGREDIASCFLYSQPRTRIWDYDIAGVIREPAGGAELRVGVAVEAVYRHVYH